MVFTIEDLKDAMIYFSTTQSESLSENCIVALESIPHSTGCELQVSGLHDGPVKLNWTKNVIKNGYKEEKKYTEKAAEAISFFLATKYTEYEILEEAIIGNGHDYWLSYSDTHEKYDPINFFNARLEVSGILRETKGNNISKRVRQKVKQTNVSDGTGLPAYISIVEFSNLKANISKK